MTPLAQIVGSYLKERRLAALNAKRESLRKLAEEHRKRASDYAAQAYYTDQMAKPLLWGRLQNEANWQTWHQHDCQARMRELDKQIRELSS